MILRIFDCQKDNPKLLVSFLDFLVLILSPRPRLRACEWRMLEGAEGYGENVCRLDDLLISESGPIVVDIEDVLAWLESGEYFYSARLACASENLVVGIADSTYLFVESDDVQLVEVIEAEYENTERVYGPQGGGRAGARGQK